MSLSSLAKRAHQERPSSRKYHRNFHYRPIQEQLNFWRELYPLLDARHVSALAEAPLPDGAEHYVVFPKPTKLGGDYLTALKVILRILVLSGRLKMLDTEYFRGEFRLVKKTQKALSLLCRTTPGDFLVIPIQLGKRHFGRSVQYARKCFADNEFGLGPYEVACAILLHPERMSRSKGSPSLDCPGGQIGRLTVVGSGRDWRPTTFDYIDHLLFGTRPENIASEGTGSASGFLPS